MTLNWRSRNCAYLTAVRVRAPPNGVTEDDIMENAITLFFSRTGKSYNQKTL
jgi:hypothetical protein